MTLRTQYEYADALGRLTKVIRGSNVSAVRQEISYQYSDAVNNLNVTATRGRLTNTDGQLSRKTCYDGLGRETKSVEGTGAAGGTIRVTGREYDGFSRLVGESDTRAGSSDCGAVSGGAWTRMEYDELDLPTAVELPGGARTLTEYTGKKRVVQDPMGNKVAYEEDGLGRMVAVTEDAVTGGKNYVTTYSYL